MMPEHNTIDPIPVILARIEAKLDNALEDIKGHDGRLDAQAKDIGSLRDRVTTIEASRPKNVAGWIGNVITGLAVLVAIIAVIIN